MFFCQITIYVSCIYMAPASCELRGVGTTQYKAVIRLPYRCNSKLLGIYIYLDMKLLVSFPHSCRGMNIDVGWHNLHIYSY